MRAFNVEKSGELRALAMSGQLLVTFETTSDRGTALAPLMETVAAVRKDAKLERFIIKISSSHLI